MNNLWKNSGKNVNKKGRNEGQFRRGAFRTQFVLPSPHTLILKILLKRLTKPSLDLPTYSHP